MAEATRRAHTITRPTWILAKTQTAARGRRGRVWHNPPGNFAASLVMPNAAMPPPQAALRSFVAALAVHDAMRAVMGDHPVELALKWPNDVVLNQGKLAGILLENTLQHLIVGIGVNLAAAPLCGDVEPRALRPVSVLQQTGVTILPKAFLTPLAQSFARYNTQLEIHGFGAIRQKWLAHAARIGQSVTARMGSHETTGIFRDIDADGHLILDTAEKGPVAIAAADIFF